MNDWSWWKEEDSAKVYAYLDAQLAAIDKRQSAQRKRYITHEIYCSGCDSIVVQVVALKYPDPDDTDCRVIRWRDRQTLPLNLPNADGMVPSEHGRLAAEAVARRPESYRPGEWRYHLVTDNAVGQRSIVFPVCNCGNHTFSVSGILARPGRKSTTRRPRT